MDDLSCTNCGVSVGEKIPSKDKKVVKNYARTGLHGKLRRTAATPAEIINQHMHIDVTPGRNDFLCQECASRLQSLQLSFEKSKQELQNFCSANKAGTYLSRKSSVRAKRTLDLTSPHSSKKPRLTLTPRRVSTPKSTPHSALPETPRSVSLTQRAAKKIVAKQAPKKKKVQNNQLII
jgi:hypothetical protein